MTISESGLLFGDTLYIHTSSFISDENSYSLH